MPGTRYVHRFPLALSDEPVEFAWPDGAEIVHVGCKPHEMQPSLWVLLKDGPVKRRRFRVFGTGHPISDAGLQHVGSALTWDAQFVWHVFEQRIEAQGDPMTQTNAGEPTPPKPPEQPKPQQPPEKPPEDDEDEEPEAPESPPTPA